VAEFLVELYVSRANAGAVENGAERTRLAAEALTREGTPVQYLRSIFVPEDETCFFLCEAPSAKAVHEAVRRAALPFERIAEAVAVSKPEEDPV
jgi:Protein of unknown function (DUF4242)